MKRINLHTTIKVIYIILGAIIATNAIYFIQVISKTAQIGAVNTPTVQKDMEIQELIAEIEKNGDRIKEVLK